MSLSHWTTQRIESPAHWRLLNRSRAVYKNTKFTGYFDLKYHCWNMQLWVNSSWRLVFSVLVNVLKKKSAFVVHIWNEWKNRNSVSADWICIFFQVINYSWLYKIKFIVGCLSGKNSNCKFPQRSLLSQRTYKVRLPFYIRVHMYGAFLWRFYIFIHEVVSQNISGKKSFFVFKILCHENYTNSTYALP